MKHILLLTALVASAVATTTNYLEPQQVSYAGYKVVRVPVGNDVSTVVNIVEKLGLETWKPLQAGTFVDVVVPPEKV